MILYSPLVLLGWVIALVLINGVIERENKRK